MVLESNRREFVRVLLGGAAGLAFAVPAFGQSATAITVTKLTDKLAVLAGDGGNVALLIADDGLMLIDSGLAPRAADLLKTIADIDRRKIQVLFNTHFHFDHVGANETIGKAGARIVAHDNVKKRLSMRIVSEAFSRTFEPLAPKGIPSETFAASGQMIFGRERIEYTHVPLAHTDGDAYLFLPGANVLHTGDLGWNGLYPVIDYSSGGWIGGMVAGIDRLLKVGDANTHVIPGHGPIATKADLKASRDMLSVVRERLTPMAQQGRTVDEVVAAAPTKDLDQQWGGARAAGFVRQAYNSLLRQKRS